MVTMSDTSFCQETEYRGGITQHFRSQQAYIAALHSSLVLQPNQNSKSLQEYVDG